MNRTRPRTAALCLSLALLAAAAAGAESKYAKIKDGLGNILVGEVLPYNDDAGYKNVVLDTVRLSQLKAWESLYFRAYLGKRIQDIEHDLRVLVLQIEGVGGKADRFNAESGGLLVTAVARDKDSASYGERTEWSRMYPEFNAVIEPGADPDAEDFPATFLLTYYLGAFDPRRPESFVFSGRYDNYGNPVVFNAAQLASWKKEYGITSLVVTMNAYAFVNGGEVSEGKNKTVLQLNDDGTLEEKEKLAGVETYKNWIKGKRLAAGKFTVILD